MKTPDLSHTGTVFRLAGPTMLEQLMHTAVQYIDTAMVGALGTAATAAVGSTTTVNWLIGSTIGSMGVGFLAYIAQARGAGDYDRARRASAQAVLMMLVIGLIFALERKDSFPLQLFLRVAYYLCVTQIFCESVRMMGMRWGFVRAEQLLSGVGIFFILLYVCVKTPGLPFLKRFWPLFGTLACIGGLVGVEFALDRTEIPDVYWYGVMLLILIVFGLLEAFCVRRRLRMAKA